jgi:hypothetical protein
MPRKSKSRKRNSKSRRDSKHNGTRKTERKIENSLEYDVQKIMDQYKDTIPEYIKHMKYIDLKHEVDTIIENFGKFGKTRQ